MTELHTALRIRIGSIPSFLIEEIYFPPSVTEAPAVSSWEIRVNPWVANWGANFATNKRTIIQFHELESLSFRKD